MSHLSLGRRIFRDTATVSIIGTAGQVVAYLMTAYVAATFGADWRTDALGLALTIPMFTANVVREAVRSVLAPTLVELRVRGSPRLVHVARQGVLVVTVGAVGLALLLALKALALETLGETDAGLDTMRGSITIAAPYGYVRTYLDLGSRAAGMLYRLGQQGIERDHINRLLPLFPGACSATSVSAASARPDELIEPLTTREMQVLEMLALRLSDKEIAEALIISPLTARSHVTHIFGKLGVNNRRAAVERARSLGLLRSP